MSWVSARMVNDWHQQPDARCVGLLTPTVAPQWHAETRQHAWFFSSPYFSVINWFILISFYFSYSFVTFFSSYFSFSLTEIYFFSYFAIVNWINTAPSTNLMLNHNLNPFPWVVFPDHVAKFIGQANYFAQSAAIFTLRLDHLTWLM